MLISAWRQLQKDDECGMTRFFRSGSSFCVLDGDGWGCGDLLLLLQAMAKAEGLADKLQDVAAIGEPIEQAGGQAFITQHLRPCTKGQIMQSPLPHAQHSKLSRS